MKKLLRFLNEERGTETVEWAVIAALLIVAAAASWQGLGDAVVALIGSLISSING